MPFNINLNICVTSGRLVATRPKLVMVIVSLISSTSLLFSLYFHPLTSFSDPNLGFETRGTELSKRFIAFENLLMDRNLARYPPSANNFTWQQGLDKSSLRRRAADRLKETSHSIKFCLRPSVQYSQVVMSGKNLWSVESVRAMCRLESVLINSNIYEDLCERRSPRAKSCCPPWSLANYIAFINNRSTCHQVTEEDVVKMKKLVDECGKYYFSKGRNSAPIYSPRELPVHCKNKRAIFNTTFYLLDSHYWDENEDKNRRLENVLVLLPVGQSRVILPYYNSLSISTIRFKDVHVSAINFGVKDTVFNERLLKDSWLLLVGLGLVALCFYLYTASVLLTLATLFNLVFSMSLAYFLYTVVLRFSFFPFINLLSSVVVIGVGGDASLIVCKAWATRKMVSSNISQFSKPVLELGVLSPQGSSNPREESEDMESSLDLDNAYVEKHKVAKVQAVYLGVAQPLALTSLTTAAAFFASYLSSITSIACFGVFSGGVVLSSLVVTWWWLPSCLVLMEDAKVPQAAKSRDRHLGALVLSPRLFWLLLFPALTTVAGLVLVKHGGLPVQDRPSLQLLLSTDPIEKFHLLYSQRFWMYRLDEASLERLNLRWIWGVLPLDDGDHLDPESRGSLHLDPTFNFSHPDSQIFFYNFCKNIRREDWYGGSAAVVGGRCFPESLSSWMSRRCIGAESESPCCGWPPTPPYPESVYRECALRAAESVHYSALRHPVAGPYFLTRDSNPTVRALVIEFDANQTFTTSYHQVKAFYKEVEEWTTKELSKSGGNLSRGWFLSDLHLYDLQSSLRYDTCTSLLTAACLVLMFLLSATRDPYLSAAAVISVLASTLCVAAILLLLGWHLDVLESTTASLAVGLAVDFTIHYAIHYKKSGQCASETLDEVGGPTLVCMITSCLAGLVMMPSQVLPYRRVSVFLIVLMPVSWLYSTFWFLSLLPKAPITTCSRRRLDKDTELESLRG